MREGVLTIISAPSGAGKGTIRALLQKRMPKLRYGVSVTTRQPREGEVDGINYYFMDEEVFKNGLSEGKFVEHAEVYGNYYATPRQPMEDWLKEGIDVIIEKDVQGALALKNVYPEAVYVFILPPSLEELRQRITRRGTETEQARSQRLKSAEIELNYINHYDYVIVNDDLDKAVSDLQAIIVSESLKIKRQKAIVEKLIGKSLM